MPFKSKAQQRYMFAAEARHELPKGTARRWAHHTKNMKTLPDRADKKKHDAAKKAFVERFLADCFAAKLSPPQIAERAEKLAQVLEKRADGGVGDVVGGILGGAKQLITNTGILGTVGLPAMAGGLAGVGIGHLRNELDHQDIDAQRRYALARLYQRRADALAAQRHIRVLQDSAPGKYVPLG